jgi:hypothetical protein
MMTFVGKVLAGTPIWVWGLLALLVFLGVRQLRQRSIKPYTVLIAPICFLLLGVVSSGRFGIGLIVWTLALIATSALTLFVWRPVGRVRHDAEADRLLVPGSVQPMALMLSIFLLNYVLQVALAVKPALRNDVSGQVLPALFLGALSGAFLGRAVILFRMRSRSRQPQ